ncbi:hypothetical protein [Adhaeribacter pallidiroseus]|uniref:Uncharacterized protein n=1 Tax=Adhaeribacter pallidiroseus TaxID=2072847 RepID=A0A369QEX0_9BACT|nr:hypothetical protein [Adhaeribacter pallidiroseus]RDC61797.1 hypothetical protein AHMF7616_00386 [Adhaeribacter pallidiroseus]
MKDNQDKSDDKKDDILKDIRSVPKAPTGSSGGGNQNVDDPKHPPKGGRHDASSTEDGGQDMGTSAGSH